MGCSRPAYDASVPAFPRMLIRRPRVHAAVERPRLSRVVGEAPMIVLVGAAGMGKTVLASQLADRHSGRVAWCRFAPGWGETTDLPALVAAALDADAPPRIDDLLGVADLVLDVFDDEPTVLVIEDLHESDPTTMERVLAEVAAHIPPDGRVVVTSRRRPTELIGLADPANLAVVGEEALRFDENETADLLLSRGAVDVDPAALCALHGGWGAALAAVGPDTASVDDLIATALDAMDADSSPALVDVLAVVPYVTGGLAAELGVGTAEELLGLSESSSLVTEVDGHFVLHDAGRDARIAGLDEGRVAQIGSGAAPLLAAAGDAAAAIELAIDAGHPDLAAELLAANASSIGADRATRWLYELPAELRRGLPPVLSGGRATVNVSLALAAARQALADAEDPRAEREALLGVGSLELAEGDLAAAAASLEGAARRAGDDDRFRASVGELLGQARWLAGDDVGARSALAGIETGWAQWIKGVMALAKGDLGAGRAAAGRAVAAADDDLSAAVGESLLAGVDLVAATGDPAPAAAEAYAVALEVGGRDLLAAGPIHGFVLVRAGDLVGAEGVADQVDRTVGRQDEMGRVLVALLRRAIARAAGADDVDRAERRVRDLRTRGFAPLEDLTDRLEGGGADGAVDGCTVVFCGEVGISVDGQAVGRDAWKSKKALEVALLLAQAGPDGLRRESVIESVWAGRELEKGRTLLRTALSQIRRVLEPHRAAGQPSRFVEVEGDRVRLRATTDVVRAAEARAEGDHATAFRLLAAGLAPGLPDAEWVDDLRHVIDQQRVEVASRVVDDADHALAVDAYEALIEAEPWQREHVDGLAARYRDAGDEPAAADVERRWFADD